MNISLLGGFFDWIVDVIFGIFDNIPKIVYFFFAALSSGVDAIQALVRKLAGLDSYWVKGTGGELKERAATDPLTEFVYGILGIGESSTAYKALNTVFWSLSIFALIILVLTTMVALIKSHYSEDYQNTNPWKYIYTAIKALLTYAVMPVIVVIGLQLSSFILKTLDNVTNSSSEGTFNNIFGTSVVQDKFEGTPNKKGDKTFYANYDFFGAGFPTSSQTFSGMLFQAAAYSSNRARGGGEITYAQLKDTDIFVNDSSPEVSKLKNNDDKRDYGAYQIDFAFSNNVHLKQGMSIEAVHAWFPDVRYVSWVDFTSFGGLISFGSFSKYNVTGIWMFYNLWQFNFIVAFGGAVTVLGLMLSVIIGLMSRLIKGAALFLIYPTILSIAPLDSFKAFKSWGTTFMQQVLMAYGAIVGMNILMLILPYVQNISFFGPGLGIIDAIVNMIILIVGLLMTKDFIQIVSGFIGGADASGVGAGIKGDIAATIKGGAKKAMHATGLAVKTTTLGARIVGNRIKNKVDKERRRNLDEVGEYKNSQVLTNEINKLANAIKDNKTGDLTKEQLAVAQLADDARKQAKASGVSDEEADKEAKKAVVEGLKITDATDKEGNVLKDHKGKAISRYEDLYNKEETSKQNFISENGKLGSKWKIKRAEKAEEKIAAGKLDYKKDQFGHYSKESRTAKERWQAFKSGAGYVGEGFLKVTGLDKAFDGKAIGKSMADGFLKTMTSMAEGTGIDKVIASMKDMMKTSFTLKDTPLDPKAEGDALQRKNADAAAAAASEQKALSKETNALLKQILGSTKETTRAVDSSSASKTYSPPPPKS